MRRDEIVSCEVRGDSKQWYGQNTHVLVSREMRTFFVSGVFLLNVTQQAPVPINHDGSCSRCAEIEAQEALLAVTWHIFRRLSCSHDNSSSGGGSRNGSSSRCCGVAGGKFVRQATR